jgi:hypothetical protein
MRVRYFTRSGANSRKLQIVIVEQFAWSWQRASRGTAFGIIGGLAIGLAVLALSTAEQIGSLRIFLRGTLFWALIYGVIIGLIRGLTFSKVGKRLAPNQGIWVSGRTAGVVIIVGAILGLLIVSQGEGQIGTWVIALGLAIAFWLGGITCIQHSTLRLSLWRSNVIPWNYVRFLDYCADRIFLRKVGGGYIFIHRMLMEYFASLDTAEQVELDSESQHSAQG